MTVTKFEPKYKTSGYLTDNKELFQILDINYAEGMAFVENCWTESAMWLKFEEMDHMKAVKPSMKAKSKAKAA